MLRALKAPECSQGCQGRDSQFLGSEPQEPGGWLTIAWLTAPVSPPIPSSPPEFQLTIEPGFWKLPRAWTRTEASMVYPTFEQEDSFSEELSDLCLVQLLGTGWVPWTCLTS